LNYLSLNAYDVATNGYREGQLNQRTALNVLHLTGIDLNGSFKNNKAGPVYRHQASRKETTMVQSSQLPNKSISESSQLVTVNMVGAFRTSCEHRGLSQNTLRWYSGVLSSFAREYPELPLVPEPLEAFIASFKTGDERRHGVFRILRTFYNYIAERFTHPNPMLKIKPPIVKPKDKYALSLEQLKTLLEYPGHTKMIRALLYLLADTGIRLGEAASLAGKDVHEDCIKVCGKTGERIIPISPTIHDMLLAIMPPSIVKDQRLFPHSTWWLSRLVSRAFKAIGLPGSAHTLRHTFVSLFRGSDQSIMTITGHRSHAMIERYSRRKFEKAAEEHAQASPLARLYGNDPKEIFPQGHTLQAIIELAKELGAAQERVKFLEAKTNFITRS